MNMKKQNIGQNVLRVLREKRIRPKPRWEFLLKDYIIWGAGIISVLVGALSFAVILYMVVNNDWDIYQYTTNSLAGYIFSTLPYYWLLFLSIFIILAYFNIRRTKKGYKYGLSLIIIASIGASVILGTVFYGVGLGRAIDNEFSQRIPIYQKFIQRNPKLWLKPGRGIIAGEVIDVMDEYNFRLKDLKENNWQVNSESVRYKLMLDIAIGDKIIVIGSKLTDNEFKAMMIRPWDREGFKALRLPGKPGMMDFHKKSFNHMAE